MGVGAGNRSYDDEMIEYRRRRVLSSELVVVLSDEVDVRPLQFAFEQSAKELFGKEVTGTPFPAVPNVPGGTAPVRWLISDGQRTILATPNTINVRLDFQSGLPQSGVMSVAAKYGEKIDQTLDKAGVDKRMFAGLVLIVNAPHSGSELEVAADIANMLLKRPPEREQIVSGSITLGWRSPGSRVNTVFTVAPYRSVAFRAQVQPSGQIDMPSAAAFETMEATEIGMQLRIDLNDRALEGDGNRTVSEQGRLSSLLEFASGQALELTRTLLNTPDLTIEGL
jgi:hypothetical protein